MKVCFFVGHPVPLSCCYSGKLTFHFGAKETHQYIILSCAFGHTSVVKCGVRLWGRKKSCARWWLEFKNQFFWYSFSPLLSAFMLPVYISRSTFGGTGVCVYVCAWIVWQRAPSPNKSIIFRSCFCDGINWKRSLKSWLLQCLTCARMQRIAAKDWITDPSARVRFRAITIYSN